MLEFRAGKMLFEGKRVTPDSRKGLVRIARVCFIENSFLSHSSIVVYISAGNLWKMICTQADSVVSLQLFNDIGP